MQDAINKASSLVEAHKFIRQFEGKTIVVKVGGSIMDEPETLRSLIMDICFMDAVGMKPVVVHGGGKSINEAMKKAGLQAHFVQGRRYTDERTLAIAEHVLINEVNKEIVDEINKLGHQGLGLHTLASTVCFAKRLFLESTEEPKGRKIDMGFVGEVEWVNAKLIKALLDGDYIPVIAPIARDPSGGRLNVNADSVAGHVAAGLKAEKLLLVSDTNGIRTGPTEDTLASTLTKKQIEELVANGVISAGMLPKVEASITALEAGVSKCHIIDGRIPHSVLLEVYTQQGIGTEIVL